MPNCAVAGTYGFFVSPYFIATLPEFDSPSGPGPTHYQGFTITDTPHSVGLLRTSDQPDAETST